MARTDTRYSVYPTDKSIEVVGSSSPALNQAIECWAALLARAIADNSGTFLKDICEPAVDAFHCLNDWGILADALKAMKFDPDFANPKYLLASAVEDGHRLHGLGWKWADPDQNDVTERAVVKLVEKLKELDYAHAWAIIVVVQWYWEHHDKIGKSDEWWTLAYRMEMSSDRSQNRGRKQKPTKSQDVIASAGAKSVRPGTRSRKEK